MTARLLLVDDDEAACRLLSEVLEREAYRVVSALSADELEAMLEAGSLSEGMIPKTASCVRAVRRGVGRAHILDGRVPHALLLEIFTTEGIGTMVEP